MRACDSRSLGRILRLSEVERAVRAGGCITQTNKKSFREIQIHSGEILVGGLQLTGKRRRGLDLLRAEPVAPQWPVAHCGGRFFEITKAKASTVPEEHVKDAWYLMWHVVEARSPMEALSKSVR